MTSNNSNCFTPLDHSIGGSSAISEQDYIIDSSSTTKNKEAQEDPLLSILNVVVDHVMMPPTPMEPMEFCEVCRMEQKLKERQQTQLTQENGDSNHLFQLQTPSKKTKEGTEQHIHNNESNSSQKDESIQLPSHLSNENVCIRVPIIRVFGPVLKDGNYEEYINCSQSIANDSGTSSQTSDSSTTNPQQQTKKHTRIQQPQSGCLHIHGAYPYMLARPIIAGPDGSMHHGYKSTNDTNNEDDDTDISDIRIDWDDPNSVSNILEEVHTRLEMALRVSYEHHNVSSKNNAVSIPGASVTTSSNNDTTGLADTQEEQTSNTQQHTPLFIRQVTIVTGRGFYTYCSGPPAPFLRVEYYDPSMRWRVKMVLERGLELNELYHPDPRQYDYIDIHNNNNGQHQRFGDGDGDIRPLKFRCYEAHIPYTMQVFKDCNLAGMKYIKVGEARFRNPLPRSLRKRTKEDFDSTSKANGISSSQLEDSAFFLSHTVPTELLWPKLDDLTRQSRTELNEHWLKKQTSCELEFDSTVQQLLNVVDVMTELPSPLEERQKIHWRAVPSLREIWEQERKRMSLLLPPENDFLSCKDVEEDGSSSDESSDSDEEVVQKRSNNEKDGPQFTLNVKKGASRPGTRLAVKGMKQLFKTSVGLEDDFRRALKDIAVRHESFIDEVDRSIKEGGAMTDTTSKNSNNTQHTSQPSDLDEGIEALAALGDQFTQGSGVSEDFHLNFSQQSDSTTHIATKSGLSQKEVEEEIEMMAFGESVDSGDHLQVNGKVNARRRLNSSSLLYGETDTSDEEEDDFLVEEERMGEKGFEKALTQLATQMETNEESNMDIEEDHVIDESHLKLNYHDTHISDEDDKDDLFSDEDDSHTTEHAKDEVVSRLSNLSQPSEDLSAPSHDGVGLFEVEGYGDTPQSEESVPIGLSQKHRLELPTSDFVVEPCNSTSLRRGEVTSGDTQLHPLPNTPLVTNPSWFQYQYNSSGASPTLPNDSFLEPVKRPPSYAQVKSWVKKRSPQDKTAKRAAAAAEDSNANIDRKEESQASSYLTAFTQFSQLEESQDGTSDPLAGIGNQGGKLHISTGGGGMKTLINTSTTFTPLTIMSIEVHVQCRINTSTKDQKEIAMVPDSSRDAVFAVVYVYGRDPGGGESIEILEKGCVLVTIQSKSRDSVPINNTTKATMGISLDVRVERVNSERSLLLRIASIVQLKDPDSLISWDTQGGGLGYLVERGIALGKPLDGSNGVNSSSTIQIDLARLLGRTPRAFISNESTKTTQTIAGSSFGIEVDQEQKEHTFSGSGLGSEWDDRVGAGAAASSIVGRIVLCGWKICSEECKHPNASYQPAIVSAVLDKRIPYHDDLLLTKWYSGNNGVERWRVVQYRVAQALSNILLFDALDVLGRAGEAARLSGVEFSQSLPGIRGSQYKVEGVLLRALQSVQSDERGEKKGLHKDARLIGSALTSTESQTQSQSPWKLRRNKPMHKSADTSVDGKNASRINSTDMGYFFYSPSKDDMSNQEALECQAMTLEPKSGFNYDPVIVCDFTALYPSLVIAYNLCYTTVAGKLNYHSTRKEMRTEGKTTMKCGPFFYSERRSAAVVKHHMKSLLDTNDGGSHKTKRKRDRAYAIPTGSIFVAETVLKGVLPQVLDEMLSTRAMLKKAAKEYKKRVPNLSPAVLRQIEARQLALKYVANVTYGYTSATYSGRSAVPLVADAIVECGRRTLTNAINLANKWGSEENGRWLGAKVLYGDTDSVFIKLPGRSVKEAFAFGEEYCKAVTASNPPPVQLKLEKVYSASLLQTKKKYCGMMYESPNQKRPTFEAKGIETVRRDQCAVTQRVLKNALIAIFQRGVGPAKEYLYRQWSLIHSGNLPVSDFVLTGRVRSRYRGGRVGPVQASLAKRLAEVDPGRVVRHKERLPYVIVAMPGKAFKLKDGVLTPLELLEQWDSYSINAEYYTIRHVNAALARCFSLPPFKINIHAWYMKCPKPRKRIHHWPQSRSASSLMISSYFGSDTCAFCSNKCKSVGRSKVVVCQKCKADTITVACSAIASLKQTQQQAIRLADICSNCNGCLENSSAFAQEEIRQSAKRRENSFGFSPPRRVTTRLCTPLSNCVCIDCPITYKRHRLRELEIEAKELCQALDL